MVFAWLCLRGADQLAGGREVGHRALVAELVAGHAQVHGQRGQPDLRAVVQVTFQPPQPGGGVIDRQRPGLLQVAESLGEAARAEQAADEPAIGGHHGPGHPRGGQQHAHPGTERGERAGERRDPEVAAYASPVERGDHRHRVQLRARGVVAERQPPNGSVRLTSPATQKMPTA